MRRQTKTYKQPVRLRLRYLAGILLIATGGGAVFSASAVSEPSNAPNARQTRALGQIVAPPPPGSFAVTENPARTGPDCVKRLAAFLDPVTIDFDFGSSFVDARHARLLEQIGDRIADCPEARVTIAGHADGSGSDAANAALSWDRADRTLNLLVSLGAPATSVEAVGMGASMPLSQGSDEEDAADRRVAFIVSQAVAR